MAVKDDLLKWITTNKNEIVEITDDGLDIYPTFRAAEAAADLGVKKESASNALNSLKNEGLVENVERGLWSWTGAFPVAPPEGEKAPRKRAASTPKDPLASATELLTRSLESITFQYNKATDELEKVTAKMTELQETMARLAGEEIAICKALDSLTREE